MESLIEWKKEEEIKPFVNESNKARKRGVSPIFKKKYITSGVTLMIRQKSLQFRVRKKELVKCYHFYGQVPTSLIKNWFGILT